MAARKNTSESPVKEGDGLAEAVAPGASAEQPKRMEVPSGQIDVTKQDDYNPPSDELVYKPEVLVAREEKLKSKKK